MITIIVFVFVYILILTIIYYVFKVRKYKSVDATKSAEWVLEKRRNEDYIKIYKRKITELEAEVKNLKLIKTPKKPIHLILKSDSHKEVIRKTKDEIKVIEPKIHKIIREFEFKTKVPISSIECFRDQKRVNNHDYYFTDYVIINCKNPFSNE